MSKKLPCKFPHSLKLHKKTAQLQFDLTPAHATENGVQEIGYIFAEIAKAANADGSKMDWKNSLKFKLGPADIAKIATTFRMSLWGEKGEIRIPHETTTLTLKKGNPGTYQISISKNGAYAAVYINVEDLYLILTLFDAAVPLMFGWESLS